MPEHADDAHVENERKDLEHAGYERKDLDHAYNAYVYNCDVHSDDKCEECSEDGHGRQTDAAFNRKEGEWMTEGTEGWTMEIERRCMT